MTTATTSKKQQKTRGGKRPGAGRPPIPPAEVRDSRIALRLTAAELAEVERRAARSGQSVSDFVRGRALA